MCLCVCVFFFSVDFYARRNCPRSFEIIGGGRKSFSQQNKHNIKCWAKWWQANLARTCVSESGCGVVNNSTWTHLAPTEWSDTVDNDALATPVSAKWAGAAEASAWPAAPCGTAGQTGWPAASSGRCRRRRWVCRRQRCISCAPDRSARATAAAAAARCCSIGSCAFCWRMTTMRRRPCSGLVATMRGVC